MPDSRCSKLTPPQVARRYGVSADKVLAWIRSGELRAINIATKINGRSRFLIDEADLLAFELRRQVVARPARLRRGNRRVKDVIEFF